MARSYIRGILIFAIILVAGVFFYEHYSGLLFALGTHPYPAGTPWTYQMWSGFVPSLAIASLFGGVYTYFHANNCNVHHCWRIGKYSIGGHKVCWKHHPSEHITRKGVTHEHIRHLHAASLRNASGSKGTSDNDGS